MIWGTQAHWYNKLLTVKGNAVAMIEERESYGETYYTEKLAEGILASTQIVVAPKKYYIATM